jgi:hypothetical protein
VAGKVLFKHTTRAIVFGDGWGAAYCDHDGRRPHTFDEALTTAAGDAAEGLAELHAAPQVPPAPEMVVAYPEAATPLRAQLLKECVTDAVALARWCIGGVETQPDRWAKRLFWIRREAQFLVARHQQEIVQVATGLFARGIITVPAEPAKEGRTEPC